MRRTSGRDASGALGVGEAESATEEERRGEGLVQYAAEWGKREGVEEEEERGLCTLQPSKMTACMYEIVRLDL
jgi:hypothetical protein